VSVLTEGEYFGGSLEDLVEARAACDLPLLRKDFVVDEYQLWRRGRRRRRRLLIVAALSADHLDHLIAVASDLGMDTLVECGERRWRPRSGRGGVIRINNATSTAWRWTRTTFRLLADMPAGTVVVASQGSPARGRRAARARGSTRSGGRDAVRADDPVRAVRELLG
jgi:indole-3-glycerol phosphate synthase